MQDGKKKNMKIKIIASKKYGSEYLKEQLLNAISKTSLEVVDDNYDLSIAIGGDGTFLHSVRENNFNPNICLLYTSPSPRDRG